MNQEESDRELWRRLLEWAGFLKAYPESKRVEDLWVYPSGLVDNAPILLSSLDVCFVHLIPRLRLKYGEDIVLGLLKGWVQELVLHYEVHKGKEALLLCWRLEELLTSIEFAEKVQRMQGRKDKEED